MLYASSRRHAIDIAENEGLKIHKKVSPLTSIVWYDKGFDRLTIKIP